MRILSGNLGASSISSSLEDILSVGRAHSDAKSVRLAAFAVIGLESALHLSSV